MKQEPRENSRAILWIGRLLTGVIALLVFCTAGTLAAVAQTQTSDWTTANVPGKYIYIDRGFTDDGANNGGGQGEVSNYSSVPAGYLGMAGYLYKQNTGKLCHNTEVRYNSGPAQSFGVAAPSTGCGAGNYYGKGYYSFYSVTNGSYYPGYTKAAPVLYF